MTGRDEFSVWQFLVGDIHERVRHHVGAKEAVEAAFHYTHNVAVKMGVVEKVMITDGGDCCVFLWTKEDGITFPPEAKGRR